MKGKNDELRPEYSGEEIKKGLRGKYAGRYRESTNVVRIDYDLHEIFPNAEAVNRALRDYLAQKRVK